MSIKSLAAGLVIATSMFAVVGTLQARCYQYEPGWHMVSKHCNIRPAENWQEYTSGVYTPPVNTRSGFLFLR